MLLNCKETNSEGTDEPISVSKKTASYKTKDRDHFQNSKNFHTRRKGIQAKVSFQRKTCNMSSIKIS